VIRIESDPESLRAAVLAVAPTWLIRAAALTHDNEVAGRHVGTQNIWSQIKPVFIDLQNRKCAYCERYLGKFGVEWDVEHYRPKGRVDDWPPPAVGVAAVEDEGYYLLAYDLGNYLAACKTCNSRFKRNFFPIANGRRTRTKNPRLLRTEQPLLVHPLDDADTDPEDLIEFYGPVPRPAASSGLLRRRALATIDILQLAREDLVVQRCAVIIGVWLAHSLVTANDAQSPEAHAALERACQSTSEHASCARSFRRLCDLDEPTARELFNAALRIGSAQN
jgi:hypothetical protein